ncbi:MAG: hypothetical protein A4E57_01417 [Syntrophorhabdaceae bacterium PtaU1.Bin034]|jgi:hypothetical protein|nr:MAG: hypothetical protein A4E57_01417 [Syntrophorhabdaceae bacterium PtaU1.Bin034]
MANDDVMKTMEPFSLVGGGPLYRLLVRARLIETDKPHVLKRAALFALISWLPLAVLSLIQGVAFGAVDIPLFYDLAAYVRFLLAGPLLIIAEAMIDPKITHVASHFTHSGLVREDDLPKFRSGLSEASRLLDLTWVEPLLLVAVVVVTVSGFRVESYSGDISTWSEIAVPSGPRATLAGWWFTVVSRPVYQFLLLRWLWKLFIWSFFLWRMSRLRLRLIATHPDLAGGLAFVGAGQARFAPVIFAVSSVVAAAVADAVLFGNEVLASYRVTIFAYAALPLVVFLAPLLVFSPRLIAVRRQGLMEYGALATGYTRSFHEKWVEGDTPGREPLLGSPDIQSLADLANSYQIVRKMRIFPLNFEDILVLVGSTLVPMLPLVLTVIPLKELLLRLVKLVL